LTREVVFEESEKFAQFTGNLSLVLALEIAFIADGTTIGGKMVIRLQRDWLEKESSKIISLDHQNTIKILVEVRKMAVDTFEIRVTGKSKYPYWVNNLLTLFENCISAQLVCLWLSRRLKIRKIEESNISDYLLRSLQETIDLAALFLEVPV
jgi:hypothetical protein